MPDIGARSFDPPMANFPMANLKTLFGKYEMGKLLGCGSFSKVYRARDTVTGKLVAIKCISKQQVLKSSLTSDVEREVSIMSRLRHPNVVRLFEVLASRDNIYLVMEYVKGGELIDSVASRGHLDEPLARRYFQKLVAGVGYCHSRGVYHRDLKPENIILVDDEGSLKVADFGLGVIADQAIGKDGIFHTLCGTPAYVAPEILAKKGYDAAKVDVWACGVILYVLVAGYLPFNDPNLMRMYRKIYRGDYTCPKWMSMELQSLISRLLDTNPVTRIDLEGILNDPWFRKDLKEHELEALGRFHHDEWESKVGKKGDESREMNAFDIISLSSGCDLSGLFEEEMTREVFAASGPVERVLKEVEEAGRREGIEVVRMGTKEMCLLMMKGPNRVGRVEVHRLDRGMVVVESEWTGARGSEWFNRVKLKMEWGSKKDAPAGR